MYSTTYTRRHLECGGERIDGACRVSQKGKGLDRKVIANRTNILMPVKGRPGLAISFTVPYARPFWRNKPQLQARCKLLIECSDVPRQAHAYTADNCMPVRITNF